MSDVVYKIIDFDNTLDLGCISYQNYGDRVMFRELQVHKCVCVSSKTSPNLLGTFPISQIKLFQSWR